MSEPTTNLHYAPNDNFASGQYDPASDGFNLADVSSKSELDELPAGVKGLVWLDMTNGADAAFQAAVSQYVGDSNLYGFYLADEPDPTQVSAANLKAESDWIHAHVPGAKTFIVEQNMAPDESPSFVGNFTPANTDIDLFGIDPYPVRSQYAGGADYSVITKSVAAAEAAGIAQNQIVPVYQVFGGGGYSSWTMPTAAQEQQILQTWGSAVPNPSFDVAYSWGTQDGDTALENTPALQQVFAAHNAATSTVPAGGTGSTDSTGSTGSTTTDSSGSTSTGTNTSTTASTSKTAVMTVTDTAHDSASVPVVTAGTLSFTGPLNTTVQQTASAGVDQFSSAARLNRVTLNFGSESENISFVKAGSLHVTGGSGTDIVSAGSAKNNVFTAGSGTLEVTGGPRADRYSYGLGSGELIVDNFVPSQGDTLDVSASLKSSMQAGTDGHGGTLLSFGTNHSIDLVGLSTYPTAAVKFV